MPPFRQIILTADRISRHVLQLITRNLPPDIALHNCYGVAEAPYLLTGRVDPARPETASLFDFPDATRVDYRLEPLDQTEVTRHTDTPPPVAVENHPPSRHDAPLADADVSASDATPMEAQIGYCLQVRGNGVFLGYLREAADGVANIVAPLSDEGFYDTGDIFRIMPHQLAPDRQALRLVGRRDRRLTWMGYRIEPEEIEIAAEAIIGVEHAIVSITATGELVCKVFGDMTMSDFRNFQPVPGISPSSFKIIIGSSKDSERKIR